MRVARGEQVGERAVELGDLRLEVVDLGCESRVVGGEFARRLEVLAGLLQSVVGRHHGGEFGEPLAHPTRCRRIVVQRRVGQLLLQTRVFGQDVVDGRRLGLPRHECAPL